MTTTLAGTVEDRLASLERANRRLKVAGVAMFVGVVAGGAALNQVADEVATRRLVVVGPNNEPRIILSVDEQFGGAWITINKPKEPVAAARFVCNPQGGGEILLWDNAGVRTFHAPQ